MKKEKTIHDTEFDHILKLEPTSAFELKARTGHLTALDLISKKVVTVKFKKTSSLFRLLSGYLDIKQVYRKTRLIAVEVDKKGEAVVLEGKHLSQVERKYKKLMTPWNTFKNSMGIKE